MFVAASAVFPITTYVSTARAINKLHHWWRAWMLSLSPLHHTDRHHNRTKAYSKPLTSGAFSSNRQSGPGRNDDDKVQPGIHPAHKHGHATRLFGTLSTFKSVDTSYQAHTSNTCLSSARERHRVRHGFPPSSSSLWKPTSCRLAR